MQETKTPKGFFTYFHHAAVIRQLSDSDAGRVYKALLEYGDTGELPDFGSCEGCALVFTMLTITVSVTVRNVRIAVSRQNAVKRKRGKKRLGTPTNHKKHSCDI